MRGGVEKRCFLGTDRLRTWVPDLAYRLVWDDENKEAQMGLV